MTDEPLRWAVEIIYRSDSGLLDVHHHISELEDLQEIVERGPHWDAIQNIQITRTKDCEPITVEKALTL